MSERSGRAAFLAAGTLRASVAALVLGAGLLAAAEEPAALVRRADRVRAAFGEGRLRVRVTSTRPGTPPVAGEFDVWVKGVEKVRVDFLAPGDEGKRFLAVGDDAWLLLPGTKNPIKVPRSHRITGGFAVADVARTRFQDDYDALLERPDTLDGRECVVLRLMERAGRKPAFPVLRVWVDLKEGLYRKVVFLLPSGKTAREASFDTYGPLRGALSVTRMTIADTLKPGTTVVDYLDAEKRPVPDSFFDRSTGRE